MKIRAGFVSNSSSSSFCMVGTQFDSEELFRSMIKKNKKKKTEDENDEDDGRVEFCEKIESQVRTDFPELSLWTRCDYELLAIGLNIYSMKKDETMGQFEERAQDIMNKFVKKYKLPAVCCDLVVDETDY